MGAGKSTIGRQLASRLGFQFLDTDHVIEARTGADIPWIFDIEGEAGFRDRETVILTDLVNNNQAVIATGGGIVLRAKNRQLLKSAGLVVYLTASIEQLVARTFKDKKRPLLQVADPKSKIKEIFVQRDPIYREIADCVIVTDGIGAKAIVNKIADLI
ncbi:MAG: shikimate kinase [Lentisphaeria bacterium]|jgi:shikimate kinase